MVNQATVLTHHARDFLKKSNVKSLSNNKDQSLIEKDAKKDEANIILHLNNNYKQ